MRMRVRVMRALLRLIERAPRQERRSASLGKAACVHWIKRLD